MKYFLFSILIFIGLSTSVSAQSYEIPMTMDTRFGSTAHFFQGYRKLKSVQVKNVLKANPEAFVEYRKGKSWYTSGNALKWIGAASFGTGLIGYFITKESPYLYTALAGVGVAAVSFPFYKKGNAYMHKAVDIHNEGVRKYSFWDHKELRFIASSNGLGIGLQF